MAPGVLPSQVLTALRAGNKLEAVKQLRWITGASLKDAKDRIDAFERAHPVLPASTFDPPPERKSGASFVIPPQAIEAVKRGNLVEAVKIIRETIGGSLVEAKALAEHIQRTAGAAAGTAQPTRDGRPFEATAHAPSAARAGLAPGEVARNPGAGKWLALIVLGAAVLGGAFLLR